MGQNSEAKEKLLSSALELMYGRSYGDVGVQELCEHAGIQKGSFYHFFPSKRDLTLAALDRQEDMFRRHVLEPAFSAARPPLERIDAWFDGIAGFLAAMKQKTGHVPGCPVGNLAVEMSTQDEVIRRKVDVLLKKLSTFLEQTLTDAVQRGDLPSQDVAASAQALVAYMEGVLLLAKAKNDPFVVTRLGRVFTRRLLADYGPAKSGKGRS